eukprot:gnl/MRDRNA2_/MRDRNA2_58955_c0_seq1.p1 gnl/MRDRNA2_/MRDRNA2_58955_c0~~gnl/MRDRNA2_/MRDRNA2_58955_c0_seq1.p1  ORF type:complete len:479 (+),score=90.54 gnl/MRDRNA2_/MRDRNA2_58955_c0_seq1:175-1437(+)
MAFLGPPGTGKTTVARLIAKAFCKLGLVKHNRLVEVRPDELISEDVRDTEKVLQKKLGPGFGGVVFIDEAYLFYRNRPSARGSYEQEIRISALMKLLDQHDVDTFFIFAGYGEDMEQFLDCNAGLRRRIPEILHFTRFDPEAFQKILTIKAKKQRIGLLRSISMNELEEKMFQYSQNVSNLSNLSNTRENFLAFLEDFSLGPKKMQALFQSIPATMRDKMGGHIADLILNKAFTIREARIFDEQLIDIDQGTCLPQAKAMYKTEQMIKIFGSVCPVVWFYTFEDLTAATHSMVSNWDTNSMAAAWDRKVRNAHLGVHSGRRKFLRLQRFLVTLARVVVPRLLSHVKEMVKEFEKPFVQRMMQSVGRKLRTWMNPKCWHLAPPHQPPDVEYSNSEQAVRGMGDQLQQRLPSRPWQDRAWFR